jgi:hypothetical protein
MNKRVTWDELFFFLTAYEIEKCDQDMVPALRNIIKQFKNTYQEQVNEDKYIPI